MNGLKQKYGEWALITGASSGIGKEFAIQLAGSKINLILVARRHDRLTELAAMLFERHEVEVRHLSLDLSDPDFMPVLEKEIDGMDIGILINNAGFAVTGKFLETDISDQLSVLNLNCRATLMITSKLGRLMRDRKRGAIINVSSASAYLPVPNWSVYSASKAFVLQFTEALWHELRNSGVDVLATCPGPTKTEFGQRSNTRSTGMTAQEVVARTLSSLSSGPSVVVGFKNILGVFVLRFFGRASLTKIGTKVVRTE